jgi:hypothetical protein
MVPERSEGMRGEPSGGRQGDSDEAAEAPLREPGDNPVDTSVLCTLTRFGLRSGWHLLPTYLDYRRVSRQVARSGVPGLLRSAFLIENARTCYVLSIWTHADAIPQFGTNITAHVDAGNRILARLAFDQHRGPEIWSTKWQLASVSNNLNWEGLDLRAVLLQGLKEAS